MNCIIVDDEPLAREAMKLLIEESDNLQLIGSFNSAATASDFMEQQGVDLVFLDIQMPGITGIEFARTISKKTLVIFTTAYTEYALDSYEVDAIDYLIKPVEAERFQKAVDKALSYHSLLLKEENAELLINGKRVESDYTFTADSETMKVEVAFTFDATSLDGKQLVTFEELYDLSNPDEPKKVTEHKDIEDKGQTITFKEKPEEPEKPETPQTPEKPNRPSDSPKTGDSTNVMAFVVMLLVSAGGLAGTYLYKRRKMKKS
jgi:LPXTG-motif cell wall-anchored protein